MPTKSVILDHNLSPKAYRNVSAFTILKGLKSLKMKKQRFNRAAEPLSKEEHELHQKEIEIGTQLYLTSMIMNEGVEKAKDECMPSEIPFVENFGKMPQEAQVKFRLNLLNKF